MALHPRYHSHTLKTLTEAAVRGTPSGPTPHGRPQGVFSVSRKLEIVGSASLGDQLLRPLRTLFQFFFFL